MSKTVALIYGGPSAEYDVSVNSAKAVRKALKSLGYTVVDVHISKDESWHINNDEFSTTEAMSKLSDVDVAFLAVHGTYGEDGQLQALLAKYKIPFTGSGSEVSALAMDKLRAGEVFDNAGLRVPRTEFAASPKVAQSLVKQFSKPVVIKPVSQGSSVGVCIVRRDDQVDEAIEVAFKHDKRIIIQEFISGREVSCGVLAGEEGKLIAFPPTELIVMGADFFDYHSKYTPGATNEVTPPDMSDDTILEIQDLARRAHEVLGCEVYSRTDMIVADEIYVIETNTLPGMTETSILPQQAVASGMTFEELVQQVTLQAHQ